MTPVTVMIPALACQEIDTLPHCTREAAVLGAVTLYLADLAAGGDTEADWRCRAATQPQGRTGATQVAVDIRLPEMARRVIDRLPGSRQLFVLAAVLAYLENLYVDGIFEALRSDKNKFDSIGL
jgi:hypothetical protein